MKREQIIIRTSIVGICANIVLAAFKAFVGLLSHSIAIVLDAVNNLSDALSSVITILGTRYANKAPDKEHPYGHGRAEYISAGIISVIVLYAGVTSLGESVKKIISPQTPEYTGATLLIVASAVLIKLVLGQYVRKTGERVRSEALIDSGKDATMDALISLATFVAAIVYLFSHIRLEAWLGLAISLVIVKSGIDMLRETFSRILGERVDRELALGVKETITSYADVGGAFDLILHNYGPDAYLGSVHVEVPDTMTADAIDTLTRKITGEVLEKHGVLLTAIGVYSVNTKDEYAVGVRKRVEEIIASHTEVLQLHGFYLDRERKTLQFDIIVDFAADREAVFAQVKKEVGEAFPDLAVTITLDFDVSD